MFEEVVEVLNAGAKLKGGFSRVTHENMIMTSKAGMYAFAVIFCPY